MGADESMEVHVRLQNDTSAEIAILRDGSDLFDPPGLARSSARTNDIRFEVGVPYITEIS
jgi:hypothetical protein